MSCTKIIEKHFKQKLDEINNTVKDNVNHPSHYTTGKFETIKVIEDITNNYQDGFLAYCVGNAIKYLSRAPMKHETPIEDLRKAQKYLEFALSHLEGEEV